MRARIIETLKETPQNANQLATLLDLDYKTVRRHIDILDKNTILTSIGEGYATTYFLSAEMEQNYAVFEDIRKRMWKK